jgi:hypothetical protein
VHSLPHLGKSQIGAFTGVEVHQCGAGIDQQKESYPTLKIEGHVKPNMDLRIKLQTSLNHLQPVI